MWSPLTCSFVRRSCSEDDIACKVLTRVVGHYPKTNRLQIDCGWTGTSAQGKEYNYGAIEGHSDLVIENLKQEAGTVTSADGSPIDYEKYPIGTMFKVKSCNVSTAIIGSRL